MRTTRLTEEEFRTYWRAQLKDCVIEQLWDVILHCEDLRAEIAELEEENSRLKSSGGITKL